jgi:tRNA(Arg) A34 adenosine deaminase TadA
MASSDISQACPCGQDHGNRPEPPARSSIGERWDCPVWSLAKLDDLDLAAAAKERHRIYMGLLMAIIRSYWNGRKNGRYGDYPWNGDPEPYFPYEYKGHNIGAIAVDGNGRVLDFDFNHNKLFNSSAEHAEARLIRRIFALAQISGIYDEIETEDVGSKKLTEYDLLSEVTIYTSLESCAQCAGAMALGNVRQVVYLQTDPGMYLIGNMLHNLSGDLPRAPRPVTTADFSTAGVDFADYSRRLEDGYVEFVDGLKAKPFFRPNPKAAAQRKRAPWDPGTERDEPDDKPSISSFLCTELARDVFEDGGQQFVDLAADPSRLQCADAPALDDSGDAITGSLTNAEALKLARRFLDYAQTNGRRGTPHRA